MPAVKEVTPADLKARLDAGERLTLLDVREPVERDLASIPVPASAEVLDVPMGEVSLHLDDLTKAAASGPVVVYCHHGQRSMVVATWLQGRGLSGLENLAGGIDAWSIRVDRSVPRY